MADQRSLDRLPVLVTDQRGTFWLADDGDARPVTRGAAIARATDTPLLMINAALTSARLGYGDLSGLDLLELFAFVRPARFCVPTAAGLARALLQPKPEDAAAECRFLREAAAMLINETADPEWPQRAGSWSSLQALMQLRWPWAPLLKRVLLEPMRGEAGLFQSLREWEDAAPRPKPLDVRLDPDDVAIRLAQLVGPAAEQRQGQRDFAQAATFAFQPREMQAAPNVALCEGGTGIGKTLGYLAPASLWSRAARGTVWVSTYTKALQRQLDQELNRLYPDAAVKARMAVVRKGRENYLCLLNLDDALNGAFTGRAAVLAHLAARWARFSRDGDMVGGDFPAWLTPLFGAGRMTALTDRRGECVFAACAHYRRCFIERSTRRAANAEIVVANHALVMINAARGRAESGQLTRIVFDEGHHLFDAADSTFALALTGGEAIELRRWLMGMEGNKRGRRRGLEARIGDLVFSDEEGAPLLDAVLQAASELPQADWLSRCVQATPEGAIERLLTAVRAQVFTRASDQESGYSLEVDIGDAPAPLIDAALAAAAAIDQLHRPMVALAALLRNRLERDAETLLPGDRARLEGAINGLTARALTTSAWAALLGRVAGLPDPVFVDWLEVTRADHREIDIGIRRHWLDPTVPLAKAVLEPAHGVVITSATLRDRSADGSDPEQDWQRADMRTGASHLVLPPRRFSQASPFDYGHSTRVFIVTDVKRGDIQQLAGAYRALIGASEGGALGLFTAISRLRGVHARLAPALADQGLPLYAQHVDPMDTGTLVDLFRADPHASLLGTDALRDGVDVPGWSLRLVVLESVPWPRPTILHGARRHAFGGTRYDDLVTRGRLAQAFGRLIRKGDDRGVFVLLGPAVPSRLLSALPPDVPITRLGLAQAVAGIRAFLHPADSAPNPDSITVRARVE
jgi:ATP-dependent DNA helicase DinG